LLGNCVTPLLSVIMASPPRPEASSFPRSPPLHASLTPASPLHALLGEYQQALVKEQEASATIDELHQEIAELVKLQASLQDLCSKSRSPPRANVDSADYARSLALVQTQALVPPTFISHLCHPSCLFCSPDSFPDLFLPDHSCSLLNVARDGGMHNLPLIALSGLATSYSAAFRTLTYITASFAVFMNVYSCTSSLLLSCLQTSNVTCTKC
jgi:hypothetical protein